MIEQYTPNIGNLADEEAKRDCVHFAVEPVIAEHDLKPKEHIGLIRYKKINEQESRWVAGRVNKPIGIVDPFLREDVLTGQRFWMFVYPGTIIGMRHVWFHPAFDLKKYLEREE